MAFCWEQAQNRNLNIFWDLTAKSKDAPFEVCDTDSVETTEMVIRIQLMEPVLIDSRFDCKSLRWADILLDIKMASLNSVFCEIICDSAQQTYCRSSMMRRVVASANLQSKYDRRDLKQRSMGGGVLTGIGGGWECVLQGMIRTRGQSCKSLGHSTLPKNSTELFDLLPRSSASNTFRSCASSKMHPSKWTCQDFLRWCITGCPQPSSACYWVFSARR